MTCRTSSSGITFRNSMILSRIFPASSPERVLGTFVCLGNGFQLLDRLPIPASLDRYDQDTVYDPRSWGLWHLARLFTARREWQFSCNLFLGIALRPLNSIVLSQVVAEGIPVIVRRNGEDLAA